MTVTIDLPPETEAKLREHVANQGENLEDFLIALVQQWATGKGAAAKAVSPADGRTPEQRVAEFLAWANSHSYITAVADDSRESIYGVEPTIGPESKSQEQWENEWRAWAASHKPSGVVVDDSRESIYTGRGE